MTISLRPSLMAALLALNLSAPYAMADAPEQLFAATLTVTNEDELGILGALSPTTLAEGLYYFHFNGEKLLASEPGQRFSASLEADHPVTLVILDNEINFGDFRRLTGYIDANGVTASEPNRFSMTVSPNGEEVVGNFSLRGNNFSFEGVHGVGWIRNLYSENQLLDQD
jgi:hypothetical protein